MKRLVLVVAVVALMVTVAYAASVKTYQVTGPVLEVKDDMIVVQKGNDKWEIARDKDTKVTGDLKVGSKVTIQYTMTATGRRLWFLWRSTNLVTTISFWPPPSPGER
jgi:opacity protein-like surface antigen